MKKLITSVVLFLAAAHSGASETPRTLVEGGAQSIRDSYNTIKNTVGVNYDNSAGPQLACMGKLYISWVSQYNNVIRPIEAELAGSQPVADMRRLAAEVEGDNQAYEGFINGLNSIVGRAMDKQQMVAPTDMTSQDIHPREYLAKLKACQGTEFLTAVNQFAQDSGVDLNPQTLEDIRLINFLMKVSGRQ